MIETTSIPSALSTVTSATARAGRDLLDPAAQGIARAIVRLKKTSNHLFQLKICARCGVMLVRHHGCKNGARNVKLCSSAASVHQKSADASKTSALFYFRVEAVKEKMKAKGSS